MKLNSFFTLFVCFVALSKAAPIPAPGFYNDWNTGIATPYYGDAAVVPSAGPYPNPGWGAVETVPVHVPGRCFYLQ